MTASWREVSEGPLGLVPCRFFVQPMKVRQDECLLTSNIWVNSLWHFPFNTINGKFGWADWKKGAMNPVKNNQWCVTFREKVPFFYGIKYMIGYISLIFIIKIPLYYMWRLGNPTTVHIRLKADSLPPAPPHLIISILDGHQTLIFLIHGARHDHLLIVGGILWEEGKRWNCEINSEGGWTANKIKCHWRDWEWEVIWYKQMREREHRTSNTEGGNKGD